MVVTRLRADPSFPRVYIPARASAIGKEGLLTIRPLFARPGNKVNPRKGGTRSQSTSWLNWLILITCYWKDYHFGTVQCQWSLPFYDNWKFIFHAPHENMLTIALTNIHYLYSISQLLGCSYCLCTWCRMCCCKWQGTRLLLQPGNGLLFSNNLFVGFYFAYTIRLLRFS
jgi:hypothetical protein